MFGPADHVEICTISRYCIATFFLELPGCVARQPHWVFPAVQLKPQWRTHGRSYSDSQFSLRSYFHFVASIKLYMLCLTLSTLYFSTLILHRRSLDTFFIVKSTFEGHISMGYIIVEGCVVIFLHRSYRCFGGKLWYLQHTCAGDTIVYH